MKIVKTAVLFSVAVVLLAGCETARGFLAGKITDGIPKLRKPLARTSKVYFADPVNASGYALHARNRKQIQDAFGKAFDAAGISHSVKTNGCDTSFHVAVTEWEYGDAGFSGTGDRDSVSMSVIVMKMDVKRVVARHELYARNLDLLIKRYVEKLFEKK